MKNIRKFLRKHTDEKGSALLVSLMVMVGLSLLGLAFVAVSETESAISANERDFVQAQTAAEAGVNAVLEMFQDADWAAERGILPPNNNAIKTLRKFTGASGYNEYYKSSPTMKLFAVPFKGASSHRFYGTENNPDVWIVDSKGAVAKNYLTTLNNKLFTDTTVRISEIRVYAPPIMGGIINANGFYQPSTGARYGVATVRVTAQKFMGNSGDTTKDRLVAERSVKMVIAETPFPTVDGAIETSGSLVGQGNFQVYWGKVLSEKDLQLARPAVGMPWIDPENWVWFEHGYDSSKPRENLKTYDVGEYVHAPTAAITANPDLKKFSYRVVTAGLTAPVEPAVATWSTTIGTTFSDGTVMYKTEASRPFQVEPADFAKKGSWLYQLLGKTIEDPWLHARSRSTLVYNNNKTVPCGTSVKPHPCDFDSETWDLTTRYSNFFQLQNQTNAANEQEEVFFPTMDYEFWKAVAQSGNNSVKSGIYYFKYVGNGTNNLFQGPGGATKDILEWVNAFPGANGKPQNGLQPGFYFFDTMNGKNPQFNKGGTLTPAIKLNANVGVQFQMRGYIYLNAQAFGTTGSGNITPDDVYNMPGEPYRDVGYREVDPLTKKYVLTGGASLPGADFQLIGVNNGIWDFQDVNENLKFDVFVAQRTDKAPDNTTLTTWVPVPWTEGCTAGSNGDAGANCSEPHEPYLNMTYPAQNNPKGAVTVGWYDPNIGAITNVRKPKKRTGLNTAVACTAASTAGECTSNAYDEDGALVTFAPVLVGALYNEGGYDGSGNATYYGSLLMRGSFNSTGTPDVFFNECLARGCLESQLKMQRVMVTSIETDQ